MNKALNNTRDYCDGAWLGDAGVIAYSAAETFFGDDDRPPALIQLNRFIRKGTGVPTSAAGRALPCQACVVMDHGDAHANIAPLGDGLQRGCGTSSDALQFVITLTQLAWRFTRGNYGGADGYPLGKSRRVKRVVGAGFNTLPATNTRREKFLRRQRAGRTKKRRAGALEADQPCAADSGSKQRARAD